MRRVSIVIPTYEEEEIGDSLDALVAHALAIEGWDLEILVVDDSGEETREHIRRVIADLAARIAPRSSVRLVLGEKRGKGAAIRRGVLESSGDVVFTMDADLPVPLENVDRFLRVFDEGYDVVVAERPFDRNMSQPARFVASRVLFVLQRAMIFQSRAFMDTQCGFKAFRGELARTLAQRQIVDGGMVDIEYLYVATREHARVARIDVVPNPERRESKINVKRALWQDPVDLVRIKLRGLTGGYER